MKNTDTDDHAQVGQQREPRPLRPAVAGTRGGVLAARRAASASGSRGRRARRSTTGRSRRSRRSGRRARCRRRRPGRPSRRPARARRPRVQVEQAAAHLERAGRLGAAQTQAGQDHHDGRENGQDVDDDRLDTGAVCPTPSRPRDRTARRWTARRSGRASDGVARRRGRGTLLELAGEPVQERVDLRHAVAPEGQREPHPPQVLARAPDPRRARGRRGGRRTPAPWGRRGLRRPRPRRP